MRNFRERKIFGGTHSNLADVFVAADDRIDVEIESLIAALHREHHETIVAISRAARAQGETLAHFVPVGDPIAIDRHDLIARAQACFEGWAADVGVVGQIEIFEHVTDTSGRRIIVCRRAQPPEYRR